MKRSCVIVLLILLISSICYGEDFFREFDQLEDDMKQNLDAKEKAMLSYDKKIDGFQEDTRQLKLSYDKKMNKIREDKRETRSSYDKKLEVIEEDKRKALSSYDKQMEKLEEREKEAMLTYDKQMDELEEREREAMLAYDKKIADALDEKNKRALLYRKQRAEICYKKAVIIFETFKEAFLERPTNFVLEAIRLDPDNGKYREYLSEVYRKYWQKSKAYIVNEELIERLRVVEDKIRAVLR